VPIGADRERNNGAISLRLNEAPRGKVLNFSGLEIAGRIGSAGGGAAAIFRRDRFLFQDLFFRGPGFSGGSEEAGEGKVLVNLPARTFGTFGTFGTVVRFVRRV